MFTLTLIKVSYLIAALFIVNFLIALTIIFLERKNPSATLAWIMILFLIPLVGIVLYIFLSQNIARKRIFKINKYEAEILSCAMEEQIQDMSKGSFTFSNQSARKWIDMIRLNQNHANAFFTQDNQITIIKDGEALMASLLDDIAKATESINVMYYIVKYDETGRSLLQALTEKAKEGVEVRLLLDAIGSRQISEKRLAEFKEAGGTFAFFFKPLFKLLNMKLNYRNHRKTVVIDGRIGYLGGYNIGNEYLGKVKKFGYWRDTHLRMTGSSVQDLYARFLLDWRFASKEEVAMAQAYYDQPEEVGTTGVQIVCSGPESIKEEVKQGYLKMICSAKKNIYIQTPYFVPDDSIMDALIMALYSGVDVRIMIPCKPDHMFVYWATYYYVGVLVNMGAKIYIYENGFLHAKTIAVDHEVCSVGSANFDIRSFKLNFEVNAFIYDEQVTQELETIYEDDMKLCRELTKESYTHRPLIIKFKESVSRLLSDLL
ncbi:MAG: cardiolipin synthase [Anaerovorax sp.]